MRESHWASSSECVRSACERDAAGSDSARARAAARRGPGRACRRRLDADCRAPRLLERVESVACAIRDAGLGAGDRVALIAHDCVDWIVCDFAIVLCRLRRRADLSDAGARSSRLYPRALRRAAALRRFSQRRSRTLKESGATLPRVVRFDTQGGDGLAAFEARGAGIRAAKPELPKAYEATLLPDDLAVLDLHVRHDRAAQGRHALARQPRVRRAGLADVRFRGHRRRAATCFPCSPTRTSTSTRSSISISIATGALLHLSRPGRSAARPARRASRRDDGGAAHLRSRARGSQRASSKRRRLAGAPGSVGALRRATLRGSNHLRASGRRVAATAVRARETARACKDPWQRWAWIA